MERELRRLEGYFTTLKLEIRNLRLELETAIKSQEDLKDAGPNTTLQNRIDSLTRVLAAKDADAERMPRKIHNARIPFSMLHIEVVAEIFLFALLDYDADERDGTRACLSPILEVCSFWNDIALHTPRLWSTIVFKSHISLEMLGLQIARSKSAPLHIFIEDPALHDVYLSYGFRAEEPAISIIRDELQKYADAISLLTPHFYRCRALSISVEYEESAKIIFPLSGNFTSLRSLTLEVSFGFGAVDLLFPTPLDARMLEEVVACIGAKYIPELLDTVAHCTALRSLTLQPLQYNFDASPIRLSIPTLRCLHIAGSVLMSMISNWIFPHLTHLILSDIENDLRINRFCFPTLRTLVLDLDRSSDEDRSVPDFALTTLRSHPCLFAIEFATYQPSSAIHALEALSSISEICPRLTHVRLFTEETSPPRAWSLAAVKPALQRLIARRPHICITIGHGISILELLRFQASYPANVIVPGDEIWLQPLSEEYDV